MDKPDYILYAQHGWADIARGIGELAQQVASPRARVVVPDLGFINTWIRIEPLIEKVDAIASQVQQAHPNTPMRIVGHSMGGLIWLEVLDRHPEWWPLVESLVLVGSPVGGADLSRMVDPMGWGIGIARDLGKNRRPLAEKIAAEVPTLIIAADYFEGSDGVVPVECTKFDRASYVEVGNIRHDKMRQHPVVADVIQQFWQDSAHLCVPMPVETYSHRVIRELQAIPGMTDARYRGFEKSDLWCLLPHGLVLRTRQNKVGIHHVYLANYMGDRLFSGYVGWPNTQDLYDALCRIEGDKTLLQGQALKEESLQRE